MTNIIIKNQDYNSCILSTGEVVEFSMSLYNKLIKEIKEWRLEKSRLIQLPAYCIFPDKTIHSIVNVLPRSIENLWLVSGFSQIIIDNYGTEIISLINSFLAEHKIVDIIYGSSSFDLKNHKVKGILGYLGLLKNFPNNEESGKVKRKTRTKKTDKIIEDISNYFDEDEYNNKHNPSFKRVEIDDIINVKFDNGEQIQCQIISPTEEYTPTYTGVRVGDRRLGIKKTRKLNPEGCYSADTPFAKAVLGKSLFDSFQYTVNNILVRGRITNILKTNEK